MEAKTTTRRNERQSDTIQLMKKKINQEMAV